MSEGLRCTPGPWRIGYTRAFDAEGEYAHTLNLVIGDRIIPLTSAGVGHCPDDYEEWEANARALANAKRLFESLEAVVKAWLHEAGQGDGIMEEHAPILAKARAVIAEVKGASNANR